MSDENGSTWLTAFVVKCFLYAEKIKPEFIEESVVLNAVKFIMLQQAPDGAFEEPGRVIHTSMQVDFHATLLYQK